MSERELHLADAILLTIGSPPPFDTFDLSFSVDTIIELTQKSALGGLLHRPMHSVNTDYEGQHVAQEHVSQRGYFV